MHMSHGRPRRSLRLRARAGGKRTGVAKLRKELERFYQDPPDHIQVAVNERDMFEWHYLLEGPEGTPYAGGWSLAARRDCPPRRAPPRRMLPSPCTPCGLRR